VLIAIVLETWYVYQFYIHICIVVLYDMNHLIFYITTNPLSHALILFYLSLLLSISLYRNKQRSKWPTKQNPNYLHSTNGPDKNVPNPSQRHSYSSPPFYPLHRWTKQTSKQPNSNKHRKEHPSSDKWLPTTTSTTNSHPEGEVQYHPLPNP